MFRDILKNLILFNDESISGTLKRVNRGALNEALKLVGDLGDNPSKDQLDKLYEARLLIPPSVLETNVTKQIDTILIQNNYNLDASIEDLQEERKKEEQQKAEEDAQYTMDAQEEQQREKDAEKKEELENVAEDAVEAVADVIGDDDSPLEDDAEVKAEEEVEKADDKTPAQILAGLINDGNFQAAKTMLDGTNDQIDVSMVDSEVATAITAVLQDEEKFTPQAVDVIKAITESQPWKDLLENDITIQEEVNKAVGTAKTQDYETGTTDNMDKLRGTLSEEQLAAVAANGKDAADIALDEALAMADSSNDTVQPSQYNNLPGGTSTDITVDGGSHQQTPSGEQYGQLQLGDDPGASAPERRPLPERPLPGIPAAQTDQAPPPLGGVGAESGTAGTISTPMPGRPAAQTDPGPPPFGGVGGGFDADNRGRASSAPPISQAGGYKPTPPGERAQGNQFGDLNLSNEPELSANDLPDPPSSTSTDLASDNEKSSTEPSVEKPSAKEVEKDEKISDPVLVDSSDMDKENAKDKKKKKSGILSFQNQAMFYATLTAIMFAVFPPAAAFMAMMAVISGLGMIIEKVAPILRPIIGIPAMLVSGISETLLNITKGLDNIRIFATNLFMSKDNKLTYHELNYNGTKAVFGVAFPTDKAPAPTTEQPEKKTVTSLDKSTEKSKDLSVDKEKNFEVNKDGVQVAKPPSDPNAPNTPGVTGKVVKQGDTSIGQYSDAEIAAHQAKMQQQGIKPVPDLPVGGYPSQQHGGAEYPSRGDQRPYEMGQPYPTHMEGAAPQQSAGEDKLDQRANEQGNYAVGGYNSGGGDKGQKFKTADSEQMNAAGQTTQIDTGQAGYNEKMFNTAQMDNPSVPNNSGPGGYDTVPAEQQPKYDVPHGVSSAGAIKDVRDPSHAEPASAPDGNYGKLGEERFAQFQDATEAAQKMGVSKATGEPGKSDAPKPETQDISRFF